MSSNMKQVDGSKNVCIGPNGKLLAEGIRPLAPKRDKKTGLLTFKVRSDRNPAQQETRFVHVEVFRHFGGIEALPRLEPEDVEFVDTESRSCRVHNLRLSDAATDRLFGGEPGSKDPEKAGEGSRDGATAQRGGDVESEPEGSRDGATAQGSESETEQKVFHAVKGAGGYFDIVDPVTQKSVLEKLNDGKKVREAGIAAVEEAAGVRVEIVPKASL